MERLAYYGLGERTALWDGRWPLIALQECVDQVDAAEPSMKEVVRWQLPCGDCPKNTECLTGKLKEVGALMYDREYQTRPRASESSLFPWDRMEPNLRPEMSLLEAWRKPLGIEERYAVVSGWDIAWSERTGGDWLVNFVARLDRQTGIKRLLDIDRWQRLSFFEQIALMEERHQRYREDLVVVENDFAQVVWVKYLEGRSGVPVMGHSAAPKKDFAQGVPVLIRDLDARKWEIPYAPGTRNHDKVKVWLGECEAFGWVDDKLQGVGEHDDTVMAWWHCDWGLERMRSPARVQQRPVTSGLRRGAEL